MDVCKVVGNVVSSNKAEGLVGLKLLLVSPVALDTMAVQGQPLVAIDTVGAGEGEVVLLVKGSSARLTATSEGKPVDAAIIGIIDSLELEGTQIFTKYPEAEQME